MYMHDSVVLVHKLHYVVTGTWSYICAYLYNLYSYVIIITIGETMGAEHKCWRLHNNGVCGR